MFGGNKDRNTADNHILLLLSKGGGARAAAEESSDDQENNSNDNNNPEEREGEGGMGDHLIREESASTKMTMMGGVDGGFSSSSSPKPQELTLSYLCCENSHINNKGKELLMLPSSHDNNNNKSYINRADDDDDEEEEEGEGKKWVVERDFLNMTQTKSSKRPIQEQEGEEETGREKKPKLDESTTLNLSLALPVVSLSFLTPTSNSNPLFHDNNNNNHSNALAADPPVMKINQQPRPQLPSSSNRSIQSLAAVAAAPAPSNNNHNHTQTTYSNDFTAAASISYSYSQPFSHNPSCSMTRNSFENYEYSVGRDDQIWCGGEGTNGSVHSRFRPIGDGIVALNANNNNNNNHVGAGGNGGLSLMQQGNRVNNKDLCNNDSVYRTTSSDNISFFPSELPARPRLDAHSGDSRRRDSENLRGLEDGDGGMRIRKLSRPERILREIVSESIPVMGQIIQELAEETLESTKACLKEIIIMPEKREELLSLQNQLERRSDLTKEALSKCQKDQLEILVAVKMGLESLVSGKVCLSGTELVEIFLFMRCRNVNCKSILPVDDCDCKFCSGNKGFCSSCMCPVCLKFDCANNTCSWVGCDVCSHWCHAACGIQKNLIRPGPSLKGPSGTTEMLFHCIGCNHASEMFGFVKDVFLYCAKNWNMETLTKELDCVRKIFKASEDSKGRELLRQAEELHSRLECKIISPSDACNMILHYFNYGTSAFPASSVSAKELMPADSSLRKEMAAAPKQPTATSLPSKYSVYSMSSLTGRRDSLSNDLHPNDLKAALVVGELKVGDDFKFGKLPKTDGFDSLESIVRIKEAEARMFQSKADEARREAEGYRLMIRAKSEKMEEEYTEKLSKLCLQETEDRRRKKLEELKLLENSHCDYFKMKLRMQAEIAGLLERMETTKQQWV